MRLAALIGVALALCACPSPPKGTGMAVDAGPSLEERLAALELEVAALKSRGSASAPVGPPEVVRLDPLILLDPFASSVQAKVERAPPELLAAHRRSADDDGYVIRKGGKSVLVVVAGSCKQSVGGGSLLEGTKMRSYACELSGEVLKPSDREIVTPIRWSQNILGISAANALKSLAMGSRTPASLDATTATRIEAALR